MEPEQPARTLRYELLGCLKGIRRRVRLEILVTIRACQVGLRVVLVSAIVTAIVMMIFLRRQNADLGHAKAWLKKTEDNIRTIDLNGQGDRRRIARVEAAVMYLLEKDKAQEKSDD